MSGNFNKYSELDSRQQTKRGGRLVPQFCHRGREHDCTATEMRPLQMGLKKVSKTTRPLQIIEMCAISGQHEFAGLSNRAAKTVEFPNQTFNFRESSAFRLMGGSKTIMKTIRFRAKFGILGAETGTPNFQPDISGSRIQMSSCGRCRGNYLRATTPRMRQIMWTHWRSLCLAGVSSSAIGERSNQFHTSILCDQ
jgi:hypothetical protein